MNYAGLIGTVFIILVVAFLVVLGALILIEMKDYDEQEEENDAGINM